MQSFCENEKPISFSMKLPSFRVKKNTFDLLEELHPELVQLNNVKLNA